MNIINGIFDAMCDASPDTAYEAKLGEMTLGITDIFDDAVASTATDAKVRDSFTEQLVNRLIDCVYLVSAEEFRRGLSCGIQLMTEALAVDPSGTVISAVKKKTE